MELVSTVLQAPEFWGLLAILAAFLPGPQTKVLGKLFRVLAAALKSRK